MALRSLFSIPVFSQWTMQFLPVFSNSDYLAHFGGTI